MRRSVPRAHDRRGDEPPRVPPADRRPARNRGGSARIRWGRSSSPPRTRATASSARTIGLSSAAACSITERVESMALEASEPGQGGRPHGRGHRRTGPLRAPRWSHHRPVPPAPEEILPRAERDAARTPGSGIPGQAHQDAPAPRIPSRPRRSAASRRSPGLRARPRLVAGHRRPGDRSRGRQCPGRLRGPARRAPRGASGGCFGRTSGVPGTRRRCRAPPRGTRATGHCPVRGPRRRGAGLPKAPSRPGRARRRRRRSTWPRRSAGTTLKNALQAAFERPRCVDLLDHPNRDRGREIEADDPEPEAGQVDDGQGQGRRGDAEAPVDAVGERRRDQERRRGRAGRDQAERSGEVGLVAGTGPDIARRNGNVTENERIANRT